MPTRIRRKAKFKRNFFLFILISLIINSCFVIPIYAATFTPGMAERDAPLPIELKHYKWEKSGRTFTTGEPNQFVYKSALGQRNIEASPAVYAPYIIDTANKRIRHADRELRFNGNGFEIWKDGKKKFAPTFHLGTKKGPIWERETATVSEVRIREEKTTGPRDFAIMEYDLETDGQKSTISARVGGGYGVNLSFTTKAKKAGEYRLVKECDKTGAKPIRFSNISGTIKDQLIGYEFPDKGIIWRWEPEETLSRTIKEEGDKISVKLNEKLYNKGEVKKTNPDTWGGTEIGAGADDCQETEAGAYHEPGYSDYKRIYATSDNNSDCFYGGYRWTPTLTNPSSIDAGTQIDLKNPGDCNNCTNFGILFWGSDTADAAVWASDNKPSGITKTTADGNDGEITGTSSDVIANIQDIVTELAITDGNSYSGSEGMAFIFERVTEGNAADYWGVSWDWSRDCGSGSNDPAILTIVYTPDVAAPSISLTALSPDPNNDSTPSVTGTATEAIGTVSNVQYQMDGTGGSWTACTAGDGAFDESSEAFTCTVSPALSDGSHTIYVRATDSNGNTTAGGSESTDTFTIDATAPSSGSLSIDSGAAYTTSTSVTLTISAVDNGSGLNQMMISEDSGFSGASWESYSTSKSFTLSSGDGSKTVYIKFKDIAGNESGSYSDSIILDETAPSSGTLSINSGAAYTTSTSVTLTISATDATSGLNQMMISNDYGFGGASWESYAVSKLWTLLSTGGDGVKIVYIKFKDLVGNISSIFSDTIILSTPAPAPSTPPLQPETVEEEEEEEVEEETAEPQLFDVVIKVTDEQGNPVEGARVELYSKPQVAYTDSLGEARFTGVKEGSHRVLVFFRGQKGESSVYVGQRPGEVAAEDDTGEDEEDLQVIPIELEPEEPDPLINPQTITIALVFWLLGIGTVLLVQKRLG